MDDGGRNTRRLDYAKRELLKAIEGLAPNSMFNLVTFNGDDAVENANGGTDLEPASAASAPRVCAMQRRQGELIGAEHHVVPGRHEGAEPGQQPQVVCGGLAEADARVEDDAPRAWRRGLRRLLPRLRLRGCPYCS